MKDHTEITVKTTHIGAELVAEILYEITGDGVSVDDAEDVIDLERSGKTWDYADDGVYQKDKTVTVKGYVKKGESRRATETIKSRLKALKDTSEFDLGELSVETDEIDGEEWREKWKENFKPVRIGGITVVPSWIDYTPEKGEKTVIIGTNMAFGTGEHETTSMCVEFLQKYVNKSDVVIDVGSGSGILGISAAKLGAKKVIMTDIDECAVKASRDNARLNGVTNAEIMLKNLLDDNTVKGNVIVANIIAEVLIGFAGGIKNNLEKGGTVILSGILADRLEKVKKAYADNGFAFVEQKIKGEWAAVVFRGGL